MQVIDLSAPLMDDKAWAPWWARTRVKYHSHQFGKWIVRLLFGVKPRLLATGLGWANEQISLSTHGTTHVDAPWHYAPTSGGKPARTIDQIPLEWFYGPGIVLDIRDCDPASAATVDDLNNSLEKLGKKLEPGMIVLVRTDNDEYYQSRDYFNRGPGVSPEATRWLIDQGIRVMGIDSWGWDSPLLHQAARARRLKQNNIFWAAHFVGVDEEYCHMERLANLAALPSDGFTVCAFPLKVAGGSAGPARVVALLGEPPK